MVNLQIDGKAIQVEEGTTILQAARTLGIDIPTLCYFDKLCDIGACRVCVVEVEGSERLEAACNTPVRENMVVYTASEKAESARKTNLEFIASTHSFDCANCCRGDQTCILRKLILRYDIDVTQQEFFELIPSKRRCVWPDENIIQRNAAKCVQCGRCVAACEKIQGLGVWNFDGTGAHAKIAVSDKLSMAEAGCIDCGQCITHCPTGALCERDDIQSMLDAFRDPNITTVIQIAPATRTAWADAFGAKTGELGVERMCACLKKLGADYVFDTTFSADLTIMEEGTELLNIIKSGETEKLPLFTSCCPGWVHHAVNKHPFAKEHLSSAKSPMQMFGSLVKTWWAQKNNIDPAQIYSVALMPCTAKKDEITRPGMQSNKDIYDMDSSLTTRELIRMIRNAGIDPTKLEDVPLDNPLDVGTGAGVIFGLTGGVMEAALRTAYAVMAGHNPDPDCFEFSDAGEGRPWTCATFDLAGTPIRCAVANGIAHADALLEALDKGEVEYDFIEIMACPGGCAGGGGQPIDGSDTEEFYERGQVLRKQDKHDFPLRFSHENPVVQAIYKEYFEEPCSEKAEHYLHVHEREKSTIKQKA